MQKKLFEKQIYLYTYSCVSPHISIITWRYEIDKDEFGVSSRNAPTRYRETRVPTYYSESYSSYFFFLPQIK